MMFGMIILILLILGFTRNAFRYEKISRFAAITIPGYSLIMGIISLLAHSIDWIMFVSVIVIGLVIGYIQTLSVKVKLTDQVDKFQRPQIEIYRGWWFLIGWIMIFLVGIGFAQFFGEKVDILKELSLEILKDLWLFNNFHIKSSWFVYLMSAFASLSYLLTLFKKEPLIKQAIARPKRNQRHK